MKIGRRLRSLTARSTAPKPMMGNTLAVQLMTASNSCRRAGKSDSGMVWALNLAASASPRSMVRLAITICAGFLAAKWVAARSIISPAPTNKILILPKSSNNCPANRTLAAAMLMLCAPISVVLRTSLATAKLR